MIYVTKPNTQEDFEIALSKVLVALKLPEGVGYIFNRGACGLISDLSDKAERQDEEIARLQALNQNLGGVIQENERLRSEKLRWNDLEKALFASGQAWREIVIEAQALLAAYLPPDSGIADRECVNALLALLDGPKARAALNNGDGE